MASKRPENARYSCGHGAAETQYTALCFANMNTEQEDRQKGRYHLSRRAPLYGRPEWAILRHDATSSVTDERAARGGR